MTEDDAERRALALAGDPFFNTRVRVLKSAWTTPFADVPAAVFHVGDPWVYFQMYDALPWLLSSSIPSRRYLGRHFLRFVPLKYYPEIGEIARNSDTATEALAEYVIAEAFRPSLSMVPPQRMPGPFVDDAIRDRATRLSALCGFPDNVGYASRDLVERRNLRAVLYAPDPNLTTPGSTSRSPTGIKTLILHGTWAATGTWWREVPGTANFWAYIKTIVSDLVGAGDEFTWSGANNDAARRTAAYDLLNWRAAHPEDRLQIIAHSHGCNVVFLAAAMDPEFEIENVVALGTPARIEYPPIFMRNIKRCHNVYSEHDSVQWAGGMGGRRGEGRTIADSSSSANFHVPYWSPKAWGVRTVDHSDLHEEQVWRNNELDQCLYP